MHQLSGALHADRRLKRQCANVNKCVSPATVHLPVAAPVARVLGDEPGAHGAQRAHDRAGCQAAVPQPRGHVEEQPAQRPGVRQPPRRGVSRLRGPRAPAC